MSSSRGGGISQVLAFSFHDVDSFSNSVDSSSGAASDLAAMDWVYLSATSISASDSSSLASDWLHPFVNYLLYGLAMSQSDLPALENIINTKRTLSLTAISGLVTAAFSTFSLNGSLKSNCFATIVHAWKCKPVTSTAKQLGYEPPNEEEVVFAITVGGEEGIKEGFQWTDDPETVTKILDVYRSEIGKKRSKWDDPSENSDGSASNLKQSDRYSLSATALHVGFYTWVSSATSNRTTASRVTRKRRRSASKISRV